MGEAYRHPDFVNPDARLRPIRAPNEIRPGAYAVTRETFPELYAHYERMQQQLGIKTPFKLILSDEIAPRAGRILYHKHEIIISLTKSQHCSYDRVMRAISHEIGHAWQNENRGHKRINFHQPVLPLVANEFEADLLGLCLTRNKKPFYELLAAGELYEGDANYPTNAQLRTSLERFNYSDCAMALAPAPPPDSVRKPFTRSTR